MKKIAEMHHVSIERIFEIFFTHLSFSGYFSDYPLCPSSLFPYVFQESEEDRKGANKIR